MVTFSCAQTELRKARERELAILDEKSTSSVMAETYARKTLKEARTGGGRRDDTRDHGFCRSWKVHVREKKRIQQRFLSFKHRELDISPELDYFEYTFVRATRLTKQ